MGRPRGSKNRAKTDGTDAVPKADKRKRGGGPVSVTSMRSKPEPMAAATIANGAAPSDSVNPKIRVPVENGKRYTMDLSVPISEHEVALAAAEMVREIRKREHVLEERREAMAGFKETLVGIDKRLQDLATTVEDHTKKVPVEVSEWVLVETGEIQIVRTDTGAVVNTRAAEADDLQAGMFPPSVMASTTKPDVSSVEDDVTAGDEAEADFDPSASLAEDEPEVPDIQVTEALLDAAHAGVEAQAEEDGA
jgi:hypothetical protein